MCDTPPWIRRAGAFPDPKACAFRSGAIWAWQRIAGVTPGRFEDLDITVDVRSCHQHVVGVGGDGCDLGADVHRLPDRCTPVRIPCSYRVVGAPGEHPASVWTEGHGVDGGGM